MAILQSDAVVGQISIHANAANLKICRSYGL